MQVGGPSVELVPAEGGARRNEKDSRKPPSSSSSRSRSSHYIPRFKQGRGLNQGTTLLSPLPTKKANSRRRARGGGRRLNPSNAGAADESVRVMLREVSEPSRLLSLPRTAPTEGGQTTPRRRLWKLGGDDGMGGGTALPKTTFNDDDDDDLDDVLADKLCSPSGWRKRNGGGTADVDSHLLNEDSYDYALVLAPNLAYADAAKKNCADFEKEKNEFNIDVASSLRTEYFGAVLKEKTATGELLSLSSAKKADLQDGGGGGGVEGELSPLHSKRSPALSPPPEVEGKKAKKVRFVLPSETPTWDAGSPTTTKRQQLQQRKRMLEQAHESPRPATGADDTENQSPNVRPSRWGAVGKQSPLAASANAPASVSLGQQLVRRSPLVDSQGGSGDRNEHEMEMKKERDLALFKLALCSRDDVNGRHGIRVIEHRNKSQQDPDSILAPRAIYLKSDDNGATITWDPAFSGDDDGENRAMERLKKLAGGAKRLAARVAAAAMRRREREDATDSGDGDGGRPNIRVEEDLRRTFTTRSLTMVRAAADIDPDTIQKPGGEETRKPQRGSAALRATCHSRNASRAFALSWKTTVRDKSREEEEDSFDYTDARRPHGCKVLVGSLSLECETDADYDLLFRGFQLMWPQGGGSDDDDECDDGSGSVAARRQRQRGVPLPPDFLGWHSAGTQILARLRLAGLDSKKLFSLDQKQVIIKVRCPQQKLEDVAEALHMKKRRLDGTFGRFKTSSSDFSCVNGGYIVHFSSSERQQIIDFILNSSITDGGAGLPEASDLGQHIVERLPLHMHVHRMRLQERWATFWRHGIASQRKLRRQAAAAVASGMMKSPTRSQLSPGTRLSLVMGMSGDSRPRRSCWNSGVECCQSARLFCNGVLKQPLDDIAEYYGESVAYFFAFLQFYTKWLVYPSFVGVILFAIQVYSMTIDHPLCVLYAFFMSVWATLFIVKWRQESNLLAHRWGVLDYEDEEVTRPQFYGSYRKDPDDPDGEAKLFYPAWKRALKYVLTVPVVVISVGGILFIMLAIFTKRDDYMAKFFDGGTLDAPAEDRRRLPDQATAAVNVSTSGEDDSTASLLITGDLRSFEFWAALLIHPCLYGLMIPVMNAGFTRIAKKINNFENYRTESAHQNHLIVKVFSFRFVCVFASLYYYAFCTDASSADSMLRVAASVFCFMTAGHLWKLVGGAYLPYVQHTFRKSRRRAAIKRNVRHNQRRARALQGQGTTGDKQSAAAFDADSVRRVMRMEQAKSSAWEEVLHKKYSSFEDYHTTMTQFGYVTFFSMAFPLAPLFALMNNCVMMRVDAYKLSAIRQRPVARKTGNIGVWNDVLQIMSVVAVLTNCATIGLRSDRMLDAFFPVHLITPTGKFAIFLVFEHLFLLFKYWLQSSVDRLPASVRRDLTRARLSLERRRSRRLRRSASLSRGIHSSRDRLLSLTDDSDSDEVDTQSDDDDDEDVDSSFDTDDNDTSPGVVQESFETEASTTF